MVIRPEFQALIDQASSAKVIAERATPSIQPTQITPAVVTPPTPPEIPTPAPTVTPQVRQPEPGFRSTFAGTRALAQTVPDLGRPLTEEERRANLATIITGAQIGAQFAGPVGIPVEMAGEFLKSKLRNETTKTAFKKAAAAGVVDAAFLGFGRAAKGLGKLFLGRATNRLSDKVTGLIRQKPTLLNQTAIRDDEIGTAIVNAAKSLKTKTGRLVGEGKRLARESNKSLDNTIILSEFNEQLRDRALVKKGLLRKISPDKPILKIDPDAQGASALKKFTKEFRTKQSLPQALDAIERVQGSKAFNQIFNKLSKGRKLSSGEQLANQTLGKYSDIVFNQVDDELLKKGLIAAKGEYSTLMKAIGKIGPLTTDNAVKSFRRSLTVGNTDVFDAFNFIDKNLAKESQFIEKGIQRFVGNEAAELGRVGIVEVLDQALFRGSKRGAQALRAGGGVPAAIAGAGARRAGAAAGAETITAEVQREESKLNLEPKRLLLRRREVE